MINKNGQIWVETVVYTLIGLALIGIVLVIVTPKINEAKERIVIEQTISSLNKFDEKINEVLDRGAGNTRRINEFTIRRGEFKINPLSNEIIFVLEDLRRPYSEPGVEIKNGNVKIKSEEGNKLSSVFLTLSYESVADLTYIGDNENEKIFSSAATPYEFSIKNVGIINNEIVIDIAETS